MATLTESLLAADFLSEAKSAGAYTVTTKGKLPKNKPVVGFKKKSFAELQLSGGYADGDTVTGLNLDGLKLLDLRGNKYWDFREKMQFDMKINTTDEDMEDVTKENLSKHYFYCKDITKHGGRDETYESEIVYIPTVAKYLKQNGFDGIRIDQAFENETAENIALLPGKAVAFLKESADTKKKVESWAEEMIKSLDGQFGKLAKQLRSSMGNEPIPVNADLDDVVDALKEAGFKVTKKRDGTSVKSKESQTKGLYFSEEDGDTFVEFFDEAFD